MHLEFHCLINYHLTLHRGVINALKSITTCSLHIFVMLCNDVVYFWQNLSVFRQKHDLKRVIGSYNKKKSNIHDPVLLFFFIKLIAFYLFFPTRLINSMKHEHSCKIL